MADLFKEILPSILQTKQYALLTEQDEKSYPAFMVHRALSYHRDTAMIANEINKYPSLDKKLQYDFFLNTIRSQKRAFAKWVKAEKSDDLECIRQVFGFSTQKAREALSLLSDEQIQKLKDMETRYIVFVRQYPMVLYTQKEIMFLKDL